MINVKPLSLDNVNTANLSEDEIRKLKMVLERNIAVDNQEKQRLGKLDTEVKGVAKNYSSKQANIPKTKCIKCEVNIKHSEGCDKCSKNICSNCCKRFGSRNALLCTVCYKEAVLEAKSGKWFYQNRKTNSSVSKSAASDEADGIVSTCVPLQERPAAPIATDQVSYKILVERIAEKLLLIDKETEMLTKNRFGPKKIIGKATDSQKDQIKSPTPQKVNVDEINSKLAMEKLINKLIELDDQYKK